MSKEHSTEELLSHLFPIDDDIEIGEVPPELPRYTNTEWFRILLDIAPEIKQPVHSKGKDKGKPIETMGKDWWQGYALESLFEGFIQPKVMEELVTYWVKKRDENVDKMEKDNWSYKSVTGLKMSKDIIKYDRACLIAIKKYLEHRKRWLELAEKKNFSDKHYTKDKMYELPSIAKRYEPHYGFPVMNKVMGNLLKVNESERIDIDDNDLSKILSVDAAEVKVARCPNTPWKKISVIVISATEFHIMYRGFTDIVKPDRENGLMNHKNEYSEECKALAVFAMNNGIVKSNKITKKNVSRYRDWLREYTGREDNPIKYTKVQGYVTEFKTEYPNFNIKQKRQKENDEFDAWADQQDKWKDIKEY